MREKLRGTPGRRTGVCLRKPSDWQTGSHGTGRTLQVAVELGSRRKGLYQPVAMNAWQQKQTLAGRIQPGRQHKLQQRKR